MLELFDCVLNSVESFLAENFQRPLLHKDVDCVLPILNCSPLETTYDVLFGVFTALKFLQRVLSRDDVMDEQKFEAVFNKKFNFFDIIQQVSL